MILVQNFRASFQTSFILNHVLQLHSSVGAVIQIRSINLMLWAIVGILFPVMISYSIYLFLHNQFLQEQVRSLLAENDYLRERLERKPNYGGSDDYNN